MQKVKSKLNFTALKAIINKLIQKNISVEIKS